MFINLLLNVSNKNDFNVNRNQEQNQSILFTCMEVLLKLVYLSILLIGDFVKINKHPNK